MSFVTSQRCVMAFLLALCAACATALMAWGVIEFAAMEAGFSAPGQALYVSASAFGDWVAEPLLWVGGALLAVALWGQWILVQKHRRVTDLSWPWRALLLTLACRAAISVLQALTAPTHLLFAAQLSQSGIAVFLFLGLMAERVDVAWGRARVTLAGGGVVALAALWCHGTPHLWGHADARALLLLQLLPLLLMPAGVLSLPPRALGRHESVVICAAYALTMTATWLPTLSLDQVPPWLEGLVRTLPWWSLAVLALLLLLPTIRASQAQAYRTPQQRAGRRKCDQMAQYRFGANALEAVEALPTSDRRSSS